MQLGQAGAAIPEAGKGTGDQIEWVWGSEGEEWNIFMKNLWSSLPGAKWKSPSAKRAL